MEVDLESTWQSFHEKVNDLFLTCYNLPQPLHIPAIEDIETQLGTLKVKIALEDGTSGECSIVVLGDSVEDTDQHAETLPKAEVNEVVSIDEEKGDTLTESPDKIREHITSSDTECLTPAHNTRHFAKRRKVVEPRLKPNGKGKRSAEEEKSDCPKAKRIKKSSSNDGDGSSRAKTTTVKARTEKSQSPWRRSKNTNDQSTSKCSKSPKAEQKQKEKVLSKTRNGKRDEKHADKPETELSGSENPTLVKVKEEPTDESTPEESKNGPFKCKLCFNIYASKSGFKTHMDLHERNSFPCSHCEYVGVSENKLDQHKLLLHCYNRPDEEKVAEPHSNMDEQRKKRHKMNDAKYPCDKCDKVFVLKHSLVQHLKIHENGPIKCEECNKEFLSKNGFDCHVQQAHRPDPDRICECGYVAGSRGQLRVHYKNVHSKVREHLCDICGKAYIRKAQMIQHRKLAHFKNEMDKYQCELCPFQSIFPAIVRRHMQKVHTDEPGYVCNICGITLKYKGTLEAHHRRHLATGKTHKCPECDYAGICKKDLQQHVKRAHTKAEKLYTCGTCQKTFRDRGKLLRHETIHTGVKAYACTDCSYRCNVRSNLYKHIITVHGKPPPKIRHVIDKLHLKEDAPTDGEKTAAHRLEEELDIVKVQDNSGGGNKGNISDETAVAVENVSLVFMGDDTNLQTVEGLMMATGVVEEVEAMEVGQDQQIVQEYYVLETEVGES